MILKVQSSLTMENNTPERKSVSLPWEKSTHSTLPCVLLPIFLHQGVSPFAGGR